MQKPGDLYTAQPWFVVRGFRDAGGHGEHYTIDDDYLTIYPDPDGGDEFDPEASNWIQVYGPDQEKVARLISAVGIMRDALERIAGGQPRNHLLTERGAIADGIDYATYEQGVNDALHWAQGVAMLALAAARGGERDGG